MLALGFKRKNKVGSHVQYECPASGKRPRRVVTVDEAIDQFDDFLLKSMIEQSNFPREQFYGATKKTARKAQVKVYIVEDSTSTHPVVVPSPTTD